MSSTYWIGVGNVLDFILMLSNLSAGLVVIWIALCSLNIMTATTPWTIRMSYVFIGVGAASMVLAPLYWSYRPSIGAFILLSGVAVLLVNERIYRNRMVLRYTARLRSKR